MEFSADCHNTLFHIDDSLDHISELLLRHFVQLVPGHGIPNYFDFHHPRPTNSSLPVSTHWGESARQHDCGSRPALSIRNFRRVSSRCAHGATRWSPSCASRPISLPLLPPHYCRGIDRLLERASGPC